AQQPEDDHGDENDARAQLAAPPLGVLGRAAHLERRTRGGGRPGVVAAPGVGGGGGRCRRLTGPGVRGRAGPCGLRGVGRGGGRRDGRLVGRDARRGDVVERRARCRYTRCRYTRCRYTRCRYALRRGGAGGGAVRGRARGGGRGRWPGGGRVGGRPGVRRGRRGGRGGGGGGPGARLAVGRGAVGVGVVQRPGRLRGDVRRGRAGRLPGGAGDGRGVERVVRAACGARPGGGSGVRVRALDGHALLRARAGDARIHGGR